VIALISPGLAITKFGRKFSVYTGGLQRAVATDPFQRQTLESGLGGNIGRLGWKSIRVAAASALFPKVWTFL